MLAHLLKAAQSKPARPFTPKARASVGQAFQPDGNTRVRLESLTDKSG
jgi:hypothetical protein